MSAPGNGTEDYSEYYPLAAERDGKVFRLDMFPENRDRAIFHSEGPNGELGYCERCSDPDPLRDVCLSAQYFGPGGPVAGIKLERGNLTDA